MGKKKKKEAKSTERQAYGLTVLKASHKKIRQLKRNHEPEIHGNKLWTSSWLIMDFLEQQGLSLEQQGLSKKPRVMEVGCGWGLAGIYCAKRHGASVVGIDADENVFPYLDLHAEVNGVKLERKRGRFDEVKKKELAETDLLLGSDICFWDDMVEPVYKLIRRALRAGVEAGEFPGPRMRIAGGAVTPTGGHADINGWSVEVMRANGSPYACNGADDCARAVRQLVQEGADVIKITATGGVLSSTGAGVEQQFFQEELDAIVGAAHMMGRKVTAHAHGVTGINAFLRAGGDSIEHGTYLDRESIRLFRDNDAVLVPTVMAGEWVANQADAGWMTPFQAAKARVVGPLMLEMVRRAHEGGVTIAFGTDSGVSAHGDNAREFLLYTMAGMTEMEALATATTVGARHVQLEDEIGRIAPGFSADIVATNGDPLENIEELMDIDFVMARGVVHKNEE